MHTCIPPDSAMTFFRTTALCSLLMLLAMPVSARLQTGGIAPAVSATLLDGKTRLHFNAGRGPVRMVVFWASWCSSCRQELPQLERMYRTYHGQGLELLAVSVDEEKDDIAEARHVAERLSFPVALEDAAAVDGFGRIRAVPAVLVIDRQGKLRLDGRDGLRSEDIPALEKLLKSLLAEAPPS